MHVKLSVVRFDFIDFVFIAVHDRAPVRVTLVRITRMMTTRMVTIMVMKRRVAVQVDQYRVRNQRRSK